MLVDGTFDGQVAVVTGGGTGMGRAMALEFSRLGAAVVVAGRRAEPLAETAALIEGTGGTALAEPTDVREPEQVDALVDAAVDTFGRIDCLVNNAAGNFVVKSEDLSPNGWKAVTSIVLDCSFLCAQAAGKRMIESGEGGAIVSVIASYAWTGGPGTVHSAAAKAGVTAMTRTLAVEWAQHGIRVNTICPGPTATEGAGAALWPTPEAEGRVASSVPIGRLARVEEIAWWTTALCAPKAAYITGANLTIDGGHWLEQEGYMGALDRKPRRPMADARLLELIEAGAWADIFRAAPSALAEEHGIAVLDLGAGAACIVARDVPSLMLNRVVGLGVGTPATPAMLDLADEAFGETRYMIPVAPQCHPAELRAWLRGRGFAAGYAWTKFERGPEPPLDVESSLDVRQVGPDDAGAFARALIAGYEMPGWMEPWVAALVGRPGWGCYLALHGSEPAG